MTLTPRELTQMMGERADYRALFRHLHRQRRGTPARGLELTCIGNAGGVDNMVHGRPAGGFLLRWQDKAMVVDPGQNSLGLLAALGFNAHELTDILASHAHNDHVGDLSAAVAAAVGLGLGQPAHRHIVMCPSLVDYTCGASTRFGFTLPAYGWHGDVHAIYWKPMTATRFDGVAVHSESSVSLGCGLKVSAAEGRHTEAHVTGFVIDTPIGRLGYTSDTEWFPELADAYRGAGALWMNLNTLGLDSVNDVHETAARTAVPVHNHLGYVGVCRLIEEVRPRTAVVSHLGAQLLDRRLQVQELLRTRFAGQGITIVCPDNGDSLVFEKSLEDAPLCHRFVP